jgi:hypothetical protein
VVSVDHPHVVENYRFGHAVWQRSQTEETSTEELREALLRYRPPFDELLRPDATGTAAGAGTDTPAGESMEGAAAVVPDTAASETGAPADQDQPAHGGRP